MTMKNNITSLVAACFGANLLSLGVEAWSVVEPWRLHRSTTRPSTVLSHKNRFNKYKPSISIHSLSRKKNKRNQSSSRTYFVEDEWIVDELRTKANDWIVDIDRFKRILSSSSSPSPSSKDQSEECSSCFDNQPKESDNLDTIDIENLVFFAEDDDEIEQEDILHLWCGPHNKKLSPTAKAIAIRRRTESCLRAMSCIIVASITWITLRRFVVPGKLHPSWFIRCCLAIYRRIMRLLPIMKNNKSNNESVPVATSASP